MTAAQHIAALSMPFDPNGRHATKYEHRPAPTGLHAKFLRELSASSPHIIRPRYGRPNGIVVFVLGLDDRPLWSGHRDSMPREYRGAADPFRCLTAPDSSD